MHPIFFATSAAGIDRDRVSRLLDPTRTTPDILVEQMRAALASPEVAEALLKAVAEAESEDNDLALRNAKALAANPGMPALRGEILLEAWYRGDTVVEVGSQEFVVPPCYVVAMSDDQVQSPRFDLDWLADFLGLLVDHDGPFTVTLNEDEVDALMEWRAEHNISVE